MERADRSDKAERHREERESGKWRLLNPLGIRFSQSRIAPQFRDGRLVDETCEEVYEEILDADPPAGGAGAKVPRDSAPGPPTYDAMLVPPFPAIRVISWRPKLRDRNGEAQRDQHGEVVLGRRNWFALDNRRLRCMQQAAAKVWPRRCCMVVRCLEEVPGTTIRELRKFRTTTEGKSVDVGFHFGDSKQWSWAQDAPQGTVHGLDAHAEVEPEGAFAEDLWDAELWAPHVVEKSRRASNGENGDDEAPQERTQSAPAAVSKAPPVQKVQEPLDGMAARRTVGGRHCVLVPCPAIGWQYVDPNGKVQGPFDLAKMRLWNTYGFFYPTLPMRCDPGDEFIPFAHLWPLGADPFTSQVIRYKP